MRNIWYDWYNKKVDESNKSTHIRVDGEIIMNNIMSSISSKKVICEVCHGEKYLECCSVDGTDCEKIICPNCNGEGMVDKESKTLLFVGATVIALMGIVLVIALF